MRRIILFILGVALAVAGCNLDAPRAQAACKADDPACFRR
jgi:Prokaryotic membrane lipoprotein lipid attachment site